MTARREVLSFRHPLGGRLGIADVTEIAGTLPASSIEQHLAALPLVHPSGTVKRLRLPVSDVIDGRGGSPWWVMLGSLMEHEIGADAWSEARPWTEPTASSERGIRVRSTSLFVSSTGSVVPVHIDFQHNVLFQIDGAKDVTVSRAAQMEREIEKCIVAGSRNLEILPTESTTIRIEPGDGLYIPPFTPHWVTGRQDISISLSCSWTTGRSEDEHLTRYWNAMQRRIGVRPRVPSAERKVDRAKASAVRLRSRLRRQKH
ncbi:MAG TPA: cupin domain-containing protein [Acidimicrobiales bacterium]|nr:cupin domain-containing protein [Acidimicrobiales bacterium]